MRGIEQIHLNEAFFGQQAPKLTEIDGVPKGVRTPVAAVRGRSPRPLDDGDYLAGREV